MCVCVSEDPRVSVSERGNESESVRESESESEILFKTKPMYLVIFKLLSLLFMCGKKVEKDKEGRTLSRIFPHCQQQTHKTKKDTRRTRK